MADGLGGHAAGDVASRVAVDTILQHYASAAVAQPAQTLRRAVEAANEAVFRLAQREPDLREMGSTVVAAVVSGHELVLANVGDSRAYLLRDGRIHQLTRDHSWVGKAVEEGVLTAEQAREHPDRNVIYRSLGAESVVDVETYEVALQEGDRVLLCSDGLTDVVPDDFIAELANASDLTMAADYLISAANNRGGPDNITVTLLALEGPDNLARHDRPTPRRLEHIGPAGPPVSPGPVSRERRTRPRGATVNPVPQPAAPAIEAETSSSGQKRKRSWWRRLLGGS